MKRSKFDKQYDELAKNTSGNAHDAVTFSGKGLGVLGQLLKPFRKHAEEEYEEEEMVKSVNLDDMELEDLEDYIEEKDIPAPRKKRSESDEEYEERLRDAIQDWMEKQTARKTKKNAANGGDLEEENTDPEDPAAENNGEIITNKNKRIKKDSLSAAVKKNDRNYDERRFEKSFDEFEQEHGDVLDASPALEGLTQQVRSMAKSVDNGMTEIQNNVLVLAKGLEQSLRAQAALAAELELIKKQPVNTPASGVLFMTKNSKQQNGERRLSKSDIQDTLTDLVNDGVLKDTTLLKKLGVVHGQEELREFVESLPEEIQERL